jgi:hypothetical protein
MKKLGYGLCFFVWSCFSYVYQLSVMEKPISSTQRTPQIVIGIGDYHDKSNPYNAHQRNYLEAFIKKCKLLNSKVIVEDLSSVNSDGRGFCCSFSINARGGILGKLADFARTESIDVDNVEYRYCRVAAVGPLLNNSEVLPNNFSSSTAITVDAVGKEVRDEIEVVKRYDDGVFLNALYKKVTQDVNKSFNKLKLNQDPQLSIADYCKRFFKNEYIKNLERLCVFDSPLVDMKIIHSIVKSPDKSVIVVAAGGSHIEKMSENLAGIGYKKILLKAPLKMVDDTLAVKSSLESEQKRAADEPPAIDMRILEEFIR